MVSLAQERQKHITNKVSSGVLELGEQKYVIPESDRAELLNAITTPFVDTKGVYYNKNGYPLGTRNQIKDFSQVATIAELSALKSGLDGQLLAYYFFMKPESLSKLISNMIKDEKVRNFSKLKRITSKIPENNKSNLTNSGKPLNISFDNIKSATVKHV
jgi:hypothetical protein